MRCEVCGRKIYRVPLRAVIEGAKLTVCSECAKHGKIIYEKEVAKQAPARKTFTSIPVRKKVVKANVDTSQEMVEGYDSKIRNAREKLGLSQEELGKKINEKASVLKKIETGKMAPNNQLVTKLERTLKIKLLVTVADEKAKQQIPLVQNRKLTLGDLLQLDKKVTEEPAERKPS